MGVHDRRARHDGLGDRGDRRDRREHQRDAVGLVILVAVFMAIGLARLPLQMVLLVAIPLSLGITYFMRRRVDG